MKAVRLFTIAILTVAGGTKLQAQSPPDLPTGEKVLDDYVEATGGKAAYEKLKNRVSKGTIEVTGANLKGKIEITQAAPGSMVNNTDLGAAGKTTQGTDGLVAWEISTFTGERVLQGDEAKEFLDRSMFNGELNSKKLYTKIECVGIEMVDGKPAYRVNLARKTGSPIVEYFEVKTHLMLKQTASTKTPMGEIPVDLYPEDYAKFDGVLIPTVARQKVLGQEIVITFQEIKHNVDLPGDAFVPPKAIADRLKKKKAG